MTVMLMKLHVVHHHVHVKSKSNLIVKCMTFGNVDSSLLTAAFKAAMTKTVQ